MLLKMVVIVIYLIGTVVRLFEMTLITLSGILSFPICNAPIKRTKINAINRFRVLSHLKI